jgi:carbonic anhydrase/acetyltransferase-like protein (isoleucine patch superfamily)
VRRIAGEEEPTRFTSEARAGARLARLWIHTLFATYLFTIAGLPLVAGAAIARYLVARGLWMFAGLVTPPVLCISYILTCGGLSRLSLSSITPGRMRRDLRQTGYASRRLYGLCWTSIYYFPPLYHLILVLPPLKWLTFRLFGYRGTTNFAIYPDSWLRDLPLLDIGAGSYIANRATIGTNICLRGGDIIVDRIAIGARAMIGHEAILGLGNKIGEDVEIGVRTTLGVHVSVGARTVIGALVGINHRARIGADCEIGSMAYIGRKALVADGLKIHSASVVPDRARISTQQEADSCCSNRGSDRSVEMRIALDA